MSRVFAIADLHLSHPNCAKWRGFESADTHDRTIMDNWNSVVTKRDCVYILGDIGINPRALPLLDELNGVKKLLLGNHEHHSIVKYLPYFTWVRAIHVWKKLAVFSHVPIHPQQLDTRWNMFNIHGHLHNGAVIDDPRYINLNAENIKYTPVDLQALPLHKLRNKVWAEAERIRGTI